MSDSERIDELNNHINILLAQSQNIDNPYTESEYRALMHQIDRLTIKRDLLKDRVNNHIENQSITNDNYDIFRLILIIIFLLPFIIGLLITS
nr:MAG TPA: hypothetical protein [Caudoviricetes sp.]